MKDTILRDFNSKNITDESTDAEKKKKEALLAKYCLQCSRLFIQINQFLDESCTFKDCKFIIYGSDLQRTMMDKIKDLKDKHQADFVNAIPIMNKNGKLLFDE